jgi:hypothetical protein
MINVAVDYSKEDGYKLQPTKARVILDILANHFANDVCNIIFLGYQSDPPGNPLDWIGFGFYGPTFGCEVGESTFNNSRYQYWH